MNPHIVNVEALRAVASWADSPTSLASISTVQFDLEHFIAEHLDARPPVPWGNRGTKWVLNRCPFNEEHAASAVITRGDDGAIGFKCQHNSCAGHHWRDVRALFEPQQGKAKPKRASGASRSPQQLPQVLSVADILSLEVSKPSMLIENLLPAQGATLMFGSSKSGKTLLACQILIAVASGKPLFNHYSVIEPGPTLMIEQDDPAASASVKDILKSSSIPVEGLPFWLVPRVPFGFGPALFDWLQGQITLLGLRAVVLDSYTALRGSRSAGIDIVKAEHGDMSMVDELAKRNSCAIMIIHHESKGSATLNWSDRAAGTFAMSAATEAQIVVARFPELDSDAPERLVRARGRHNEGTEFVLRFRKSTLDYEHIMEGSAAALYPLLLQLRTTFGQEVFSPKQLSQETGFSRATAHRHIDRLCRANVLRKRGFGEYVIAIQGEL
ncbi:MAG: AAA family ATPase [Bryobacteraceae bacterium]|jgi:hypothetical protein